MKMIATVAQQLLELNDDLNTQFQEQGDDLAQKEQKFNEMERDYENLVQELDAKQNSFEKMEILKADLEK